MDSSSGGMIPDYLINLLVYFLMKTSKYSHTNFELNIYLIFFLAENYQIARHLTKFRRFVADPNHLDQNQQSSGQQ